MIWVLEVMRVVGVRMTGISVIVPVDIVPVLIEPGSIEPVLRVVQLLVVPVEIRSAISHDSVPDQKINPPISPQLQLPTVSGGLTTPDPFTIHD